MSRLLAVVWLIVGLVCLWNQDPRHLNAGGVPNPFLVFVCVFIGLSLGTLIGRRLPLADSVEASVERHKAAFTGVYWVVFAALGLWVLSGSSAVVAPVSLGLWLGYLVGAGSSAADDVRKRRLLLAHEDGQSAEIISTFRQTLNDAHKEHLIKGRLNEESDPSEAGPQSTDEFPTELVIYMVEVIQAYEDMGVVDGQVAYDGFKTEMADEWHPGLKSLFERAWQKVHNVVGIRVLDEQDHRTENEMSMTEDDYPSLEESGLSPIEQRAMKHWETFLPQLTKELKAQGPDALELEIRKAYWAMDHATELAMIRNPELVREMAEELFREMLFPPPERKRTQGSGRRIIS